MRLTISQFNNLLSSTGMTPTLAKEAAYRAIAAMPGEATLEELHESAANGFGSLCISLSTVARVVEVLASASVVERSRRDDAVVVRRLD